MSDAEGATEYIIELLKEIKQLCEDNERLRELLKECQPYVEAGLSVCDTRLCDAIEKEVGEE